MNVILTGGGTAGHIHPAIAIGEILKRNLPGVSLYYVGCPGGMEERIAAEAALPFLPIRIKGLRHGISLHNLEALFLAVTSPIEAKRLLKELKPALVVGTGGYVSWPLLSAASSLGIPSAIHESNAFPGKVTRRLLRGIDLLMLNFEIEERLLKGAKRKEVCGIPLRAGFGRIGRKEARERLSLPPSQKIVLSFGGSLGAEGVNRGILDLMDAYTARENSLLHIHGYGRRYESFPEEAKKRLGEACCRVMLSPYWDRIPLLMAAADLIITRAGAVTLSEIAASGRASVLIPSPYVANDHQRKNALSFSEKGAAILAEEEDIYSHNSANLIKNARFLLQNDDERYKREQAARALFFPDADRRIYAALKSLIKKPLP